MTMRLDATFTVDGSAGTAELRRSAAALSDLKLKEIEAGAAARQASAGVRELEKELQRAGKSSAEMDARLLAARQEMERTALAATEASRAFSRFEAEQSQGSNSIVTGARQSRAAYQQLGFQISDVAAQAAAGTNPMIIFAQQGGQIAQALAGAGGVMGRVAGFLAGPWGAAVMGAGAVLGVLVSNLDGAGNAADEMADRYGEAGVRVVDTFVTPVADAVRSLKDGFLADIKALVDGTVQDLDRLARAGQVTADFLKRMRDGGGLSALARGGSILAPSELEGLRKAEAEEAARQGNRRRADRDLATQSAVYFPQFEFGTNQNKTFVREQEEGERAAKRLADTASREATRAADAAAREAERFAAEQSKLIDGLATMARQTIAELAKVGQADPFRTMRESAERAARQAAGRQADSDFVRDSSYGRAIAERDAAGAEAMRLKNAEAEGREMAAAANAEMLRNAGAIGQAIGGRVGDIIRTTAGVLEGLSTGDFRGVGGRVGGALTLLNGGDPNTTKKLIAGLDDALKPVSDTLKTVFGDRPFSQQLGSAFQSAAFGSAVAEIIGKGSREEKIGAVIGSTAFSAAAAAAGLPPQLGAFVGSVIGTTIGGLFTKVRSGSVALTGAGGQIDVGAAIGSGRAQKANATKLGTGIADTIQQIVDQLGGTVGNFAVSIGQNGGMFRVDPTGQGRTRKRQSGVLAFGEDGDAAHAAALEDALRDGAIGGVSPRVQAALQKFAGDINRAVAEALKVQDLENFLSDRANPFGRAFREFERQAADRLKVARQYGFDVLEIERVNAEERAKLLKDQLADSAASARALLDDLRFGQRAEGSIGQRLAGLGTERSRLEGLVAGGDTGQIDALTQIIQQQLDLSRQAFGSTGQFAADRTGAIGTLDQLIRQTEDRINAASAAAQNQTVDKLTELNTSADETVTELQRQTAILQSLAQGRGLPGLDLSSFARVAV